VVDDPLPVAEAELLLMAAEPLVLVPADCPMAWVGVNASVIATAVIVVITNLLFIFVSSCNVLLYVLTVELVPLNRTHQLILNIGLHWPRFSLPAMTHAQKNHANFPCHIFL
jgi:hypothetical protein